MSEGLKMENLIKKCEKFSNDFWGPLRDVFKVKSENP
jgi:hypothetical protein